MAPEIFVVKTGGGKRVDRDTLIQQEKVKEEIMFLLNGAHSLTLQTTVANLSCRISKHVNPFHLLRQFILTMTVCNMFVFVMKIRSLGFCISGFESLDVFQINFFLQRFEGCMQLHCVCFFRLFSLICKYIFIISSKYIFSPYFRFF